MSQWLHPGIRAVFFDAVGTLLFPQPTAPEVYRNIAEKQGVELPFEAVRERFHAAYRLEEAADLANGWTTSEERERERWRKIVTCTLQSLPDPEAGFLNLFEHFAQPTSWRLHAEAERVFDALQQRGVKLGLGTNFDSRVHRVIVGFPALATLHGRVVVSSAVGSRKPAKEFFNEVVRVAGCEANEVLFVGDDLRNDYEGARAAGLEAVLLDPLERANVERIASLLELL